MKWLNLALLSALFYFAGSAYATTPRLAPALAEQMGIAQQSPSAETLYSVMQTELYADGRWQRRVYASIRINDLAAARDYGRISIPYNHYYSALQLEFANTLNKNGKLEALADDAMQTRITGGGQDFYSDSSELVFSLPDIAIGSVVEFQYVLTSREIPLPGLFAYDVSPYWYQNTVGGDGWRADFVHHYVHTLTSPVAVPLYFKYFNRFPAPVREQPYEGRVLREWQMHNLAGLQSEVYMPLARTIVPTAVISTARDWALVDQWTWAKVADKLDSTRAVQSALASLAIAPTATAEEKIRAVYAYLQGNIRYVFAHLGRGGYEPHTPDAVINSSYGDCKDQAVLAVAMLRALGVQAFPALIETPFAGDSDTSLVQLIFDHMIVHIPPQPGAQTEWLDTTPDRALFPGTSAVLAGQNVLVVNGQGGRLTRFPELLVNQVVVDVDLRPVNADTLEAAVTMHLQGFFENNIRNWWKHTKDQATALDQFLRSFYNNSGNMRFRGEVQNAEDLFSPLVIQATYTFTTTTPDERDVFGASVHQLKRLFESQNALPSPSSRTQRYWDKYRYDLQLNIQMHAEPATSPMVIQTVDDLTTDFFTIHHTGNANAQGYNLNIAYTRQPLDLSTADYARYHAAMEQAEHMGSWLVRMLPDANKAARNALAKIAATDGEQSAAYWLAQARQLLAEGQFAQALEPAQRAAESDSKNGEAWYVLATAQGLNLQLEEAGRSFKKAEQLGYFPQ